MTFNCFNSKNMNFICLGLIYIYLKHKILNLNYEICMLTLLVKNFKNVNVN